MVGVRETRRNWVVPDYETTISPYTGSSTWSTAGRPKTSDWASTTHRDYPPKSAGTIINGRHTYKNKDPSNQFKETERFGPWSSSSKVTHGVGLNGYMFMGVPQRFRPNQLEIPKPLTATTTNRAEFRGTMADIPPSMRDYWKRNDEYVGEDGTLGKDSKQLPHFKSAAFQTSSQSAHTPLQESFPMFYGPKQYPRADHVLSGRPPLPSGKLHDQTTFKDSYGTAANGGTRPLVPAGHLRRDGGRVGGKKQIQQCLPREDILKSTRPISCGPKSFRHNTEHKEEFTPKTVRHTEWYGSQPEDWEQQGEGR
eukprot:CAMPEP_0177761042 /NCGR_PEP_ID=MMETSP0491_2-20121128/5592_1 /TAXON_ID=63592 /ORGANISM="Tetraselmis chuii, Strain PLY429" /LENGTH=309 /DNA_ID=CAMNT_0019276987 /DNA_START=247 /DNA_END=1173 /DNA_ORIENTATION=+